MSLDALMKIDGVDGESERAKHDKWIELLAWSWGVSRNASAGTGTAGSSVGRVDVQDFNFSVLTNKSSIGILKTIGTGKHVPTVTVDLLKGTGTESGEPFLQLTFKEVYITAMNVGAQSGGGDELMENYSFSYAEVTYDYMAQNASGTLASVGKATFNQRTGKAS